MRKARRFCGGPPPKISAPVKRGGPSKFAGVFGGADVDGTGVKSGRFARKRAYKSDPGSRWGGKLMAKVKDLIAADPEAAARAKSG